MGGRELRITADTNLLVRAAVQDDADQAALAIRLLREAEQVAVPTECFCELVWVLQRTHRFDRLRVKQAVEALLHSDKVVAHRTTVEAGLASLADGGDFADGVIAFEGRRLGGEVFVTFDVAAMRHVASLGEPAQSPVEALRQARRASGA